MSRDLRRKMKPEIKLVIEKTPENHDSDNVRFKVGDKELGYGYRGKENGKIGLIKCPMCLQENYVLNIPSGVCTWCGFMANI